MIMAPIITEQARHWNEIGCDSADLSAEAGAAKSPLCNKACWVSNLQGEVSVPGKRVCVWERDNVLIVISQVH